MPDSRLDHAQAPNSRRAGDWATTIGGVNRGDRVNRYASRPDRLGGRGAGLAAIRGNEWVVAGRHDPRLGSGHNRKPAGTSMRGKCNNAERAREPSRDERFASRGGERTPRFAQPCCRGIGSIDFSRASTAARARGRIRDQGHSVDNRHALDGPWPVRPSEPLRRRTGVHHGQDRAGHLDELRLLLPLVRASRDRGRSLRAGSPHLLVVRTRGDRNLRGLLRGQATMEGVRA